ncbi:MAG: dihydroxyacetone kinase subunit DhaK [Acidimicrobiaceae bacterium]|nr:dihydroxyacetone kinase subunit DhaK [Acidimicrobiaceae bacterium]
MKKILNDPERFVDDFMSGLLKAHPDHFATVPGWPRALVRAAAGHAESRVAILTGGGSGHLPLFLGYVGDGLLSGAAVGNTFSSPSAETILEATKAVDQGRGVLYLYGNYGGDNLNFDDAAEQAEELGIETETVRASDDVASAPAPDARRRRGVAGLTLAFKCAGAAAAEGRSLAEVAAVASRALAATRTMGVGLSPTILPEAGQPTFELAEGEMELGIGIHGEPGSGRGPLLRADQIADVLVDRVVEELALDGGEVVVLVNSLGATPVEECYVLYDRIADRITERSLVVRRAFVGRYATSLEMAGCSLSVMACDEELVELLDAPSYSPLLTAF